MKITKILLIILFFTLPLVHGRFFQTLWIDFSIIVSGNFEFTKAIYFNIFSVIIFISYFFEKIVLCLFHFKKHSWEHVSLLSRDASIAISGIILTLTVSTIFSLSPFISFIWDTQKWHTSLMYFNLVWIFIVLRSFENKFLFTILKTSILAWIFVSLLAIKEYFIPTFWYGELSNRALWSFWHPNYLAWFLLLLLPFICTEYSTTQKNTKKFLIKLFSLSIILVTLILTKSFFAIYISWIFILFSVGKNLTGLPYKKSIFYCSLLISSLWWVIILTLFFPEKLHSFLSRFYIWETTIRIILSDPKIFLLWAWAETLPYYFNSFKVPELYIFENYWFTADRPHNFFLNIFYHFGIFWVSIWLSLVYVFFQNIKREYTSAITAIILFLTFWIFQYFSITSYLFIILLVTLVIPHKKIVWGNFYTYPIIFVCMMIISVIWWYYSIQLYKSEIFFEQNKIALAQDNFSHPKYLIELWEYTQAQKLEKILSQNNIKEQIITESNKQALCEKLLNNYPSVENYFYCWNIFEKLEKHKLTKLYYISGLNKLPDLWNTHSPYWDNYFVKQTITGNRFFSPKFSDIWEISQKYNK